MATVAGVRRPDKVKMATCWRDVMAQAHPATTWLATGKPV
jgi:hypothetical protein